jgi:aspartate 1-decarboxylase
MRNDCAPVYFAWSSEYNVQIDPHSQTGGHGVLRRLCKGKIHRATVTEADLNYVGSITLDPLLMQAADILPYEMVQITNLSNAILWHTYAIEGPVGSGTVCLNGPPARHFQPGDIVIILSLGWVNGEEFTDMKPRVVLVDGENRIVRVEEHSMKPSIALEADDESLNL